MEWMHLWLTKTIKVIPDDGGEKIKHENHENAM
jgi:hypothetical protein